MSAPGRGGLAGPAGRPAVGAGTSQTTSASAAASRDGKNPGAEILAMLGKSTSSPSNASTSQPATGSLSADQAQQGQQQDAAAATAEGYGLLGLAGVIRGCSSGSGPERDLATLAIGTDLNGLALNLASADPLLSTFAHPWGDAPHMREPSFVLPACYRMPQPALKTGHLGRFHETTLFYIFYAMPRDVLQAYAAQELYARDWRFHTESKLWFRREGSGNSNSSDPKAAAAAAAAANQTWVYWDVAAWSHRPYTGALGTPAQLAAGFLPEDEARVKVTATAAASAASGQAGVVHNGPTSQGGAGQDSKASNTGGGFS